MEDNVKRDLKEKRCEDVDCNCLDDHRAQWKGFVKTDEPSNCLNAGIT